MNIIHKFFSSSNKQDINIGLKNRQSEHLVANSYEDLKTLYNIEPFLTRLSNIVGLPDKHFEMLYETPIRLLVCRLQHLPTSTTNKCPAIIVKLEQIIEGMKFRESFIMPSGVSPEEINLKKDVWRYTTFYSLLLVDLGPTLTAHTIKYHTGPSGQDCVWNPFGNLIPINATINYIPHVPLDSASSLIFSPLIFSSASIDWLNHENSALSHAIAAILGKHSNQTLTRIVDSTLSTTNQKQHETSQDVNVPENNMYPKISVSEPDCGIQFFDWLKDEVNKENQSILTLAMQVDKGIAFKTPAIFKLFAKQKDYQWKSVKQEFNKLALNQTYTDIDGKPFDTFELSKSNNNQWIIIESTQFRFTVNIPKKIAFTDWLIFILKFQINHYIEDKPSYIITNQYIYLVVPNIFNIYASMHNFNEQEIENDFLSLSVHIKNNDSDTFSYTLEKNETINTLKLKKPLELCLEF